MDQMVLLRRRIRLSILAVAITFFAVACSDVQGAPCEDSAFVDAVYYESGSAVSDTTGARLVFEEYVAQVEASGEQFPDGADQWELEIVSTSPWDIAPWVVNYVPDPDNQSPRQVWVDRDGRVLRLVIAIHPPCEP